MKQSWDIFCAVVDNFGDIGVCWRLAKQLAHEHDLAVRLWVDDLAPLAKLHRVAQTEVEQQWLDGIEVLRWRKDFIVPEALADVVIEAFGCELPTPYLHAMAASLQPPVWLNLEYLSAEEWVDDCHGLASPHPTLPLRKHFFFPGFTAATGGVLHEADYPARQAAFDEAAATEFCRYLGLSELAPADKPLTVSLFSYENAGLADLLDAWAQGAQAIRCLLPEGRLLAGVCDYFGVSQAKAGDQFNREALTVHVLPFVPQADYDKLLWLCDVNFVRGEDSFVRAQLAGKPFVWHIYPQEEQHHHVKLAAFLQRYCAAMPPTGRVACEALWWAWEGLEEPGWSGRGAMATAWQAFLEQQEILRSHAGFWANYLLNQPGLAQSLVLFTSKSR